MSEQTIIGRTAATVIAIPAIIVACILIFFGVLFIWGAFSPEGDPGWITIGAITVAVGIGILTLAVGALIFMRIRRLRAAEQAQEVIQKIDLSGDIQLETLKCQKCGGELQKDSISVREGAIFISCPYCGSEYQMVEEPKW
jgi:Zn finger protein HypA/HybF involved in hydrogenase expression